MVPFTGPTKGLLATRLLRYFRQAVLDALLVEPVEDAPPWGNV